MTRRIFWSICLVAIVVLLASLALNLSVVYDYFTKSQMNQLEMQTHLAAQGVQADGLEYLSALPDADNRITWIAADGSVLFDTENQSGSLGNHLEREEIREALDSGAGQSIRLSETMNVESLYYALRLEDGTFIRLSANQQSRRTLLLSMLKPLGAIILTALIISAILAFQLSRRLVQPLNTLDLDHPMECKAYEELSPFLERIHSQQTQLKQQEAQLKQKKREFEAATWNMTEGLVILNQHGNILSINRSASQLLGISGYGVGKDLLLLNYSPEVDQLIQGARSGEPCEKTVQIGGGEYQFLASPILTGGKVFGIALMMFDITEKQKAEALRREFSANVSHELKTPLQTISGCAELLSSGMVQPADVPRFSDQIHAESKRLIALVEDIIGLSHLDEGARDMQRETVDLFALAQNTVESLRPAAQAAGVELDIQGEAAEIIGIPQLLSGIVFNLCDNGIKYNHPGGKVQVFVESLPEAARLTVQDTGIGIPESEQERIFERFYRVDKSRSKAVGGTGLGLSIVKHSARLHDATIEVQSHIKQGTTITVTFPKGEKQP